MNLCTVCGLDFGSVSAFDRHRVGTFEYTYAEGLRMEPMREDGRRCMTLEEIESLKDDSGADVFVRNARGRWSIKPAPGAAARLKDLREKAH